MMLKQILGVASCYRNRDKLQPDGLQLARMQTLPFLYLGEATSAMLQRSFPNPVTSFLFPLMSSIQYSRRSVKIVGDCFQ